MAQKLWSTIISCFSTPRQNFQGAHDFVIHVGAKDDPNQATRIELIQHTIHGTDYNSAERDPPPTCHPGTRIAMRKELRAHVINPTLGTKIIWVHGPAGVGKSAIIQTFVEEVRNEVVCAALFFSRPNHRDDPRKVFTTLAYRLAVADQEYCQYISTRLKADPACLTKSLDDQFNTLFVTPFIDNHIAAAPRRWVIFLDGLDECQNTEDSDNQCRILTLIRHSVFNHARSMPFVWIVASRPEENLRQAWSLVQNRFQGQEHNFWEMAIPVDSDQATRDVELYLHKEFERIRGDYTNLMPTNSRWPSDGDFVKVAKKSSGLFVFPSTVIKYISQEDPVHRLKFVVSLIDQAEQNPNIDDEQPFVMIDLLYSSIMLQLSKRSLLASKALIGFYLLADKIFDLQNKQNKREIGLIEACNILGLQQNEAYAALRKLQSVLICPSPKTAQGTHVKFFHASFPDFLLDRSRSQEYHVDLGEELTNLWRRCTTVIKESTTTTGINISWPPYGVRLDQFLQQLLQTSQDAWITIVINEFSSRAKTLQVDVPELIETFQTLDPAFLGDNPFTIEKFLNLLRKNAPAMFQTELVSGAFPLNELKTDRLFRSLYLKPEYRVITESGVHTNRCPTHEYSQWEQARTALWTPSGVFAPLVVVADSERVNVTVASMKPGESWAIVGPLDGGGRFYILPYHVPC